MSAARLLKIFTDTTFDENCEIRLDWDNDRHHAIPIDRPMDVVNVTFALERLIALIRSDEHLKE